MQQYWVRRDGQVWGPMMGTDLKSAVLAGQITATDEVSADQQRWIPAGKVKGLVFPQQQVALRDVLDTLPTPASPPSMASQDYAAYPAPAEYAPQPYAPTPAYGDPAPAYGEPTPAYGEQASPYGQSAPPFDEAPPGYGYQPPQATFAPAARKRTPSRSLKIGIVAAIVLLIGVGGAAAWFMLRSGSSRQAINLAPGDATGIVFINVSSARDDALKVLETKRSAMKIDFEQLKKGLNTIDWIAFYFPTSKKFSDEPMVIIRGKWTTADVTEFSAKTVGALKSKGNGRYSVGTDDGHIVVGLEASDVDDDLVLYVPDRYPIDDLASQLGKGSDTIRSVTADVDTGAPFWAAVRLPASSDAPFESLKVSVNTQGQGKAAIVFVNEKDAVDASKKIPMEFTDLMKKSGSSPDFKIDLQGKTLTISQNAKLEIAKALLSTMD